MRARLAALEEWLDVQRAGLRSRPVLACPFPCATGPNQLGPRACPRTMPTHPLSSIEPCAQPYRQEEDGEGEVQRFDDERVQLQEWMRSVEARRVSVNSDGGDGDGDGDGDGGDADADESEDETGKESVEEVDDEADEEDGNSD